MNWKQRSSQKEELDDLDFEGKQLEKSLDELAWVHRNLGGRQITLSTLKKALMKGDFDRSKPIHILDAGCGGGDSLRTMARWGEKNGWNFALKGIDGNAATIAYAKKRSEDHQNIAFEHKNIFGDEVDWGRYDIVNFALVLHHFENEEIDQVLQKCYEANVPMICINDLHRHPLAYYLFSIVTPLLAFSKISRDDGLISIRKAFTSSEIKAFLNKSGYENHDVQWKWAFRFEAIAEHE